MGARDSGAQQTWPNAADAQGQIVGVQQTGAQ